MTDLTKLKENSKEQREALLAAKNGDKIALENLLIANEPLIVSRINSLGYYLLNNEYEDLFQEGRIGLIEAINAFDFSFDTAFSTYAVNKIDKNIRRCKTNTSKVHIAEYKQHQLAHYNKTYNELQITLGRIPTQEELASKLNLTVLQVIELQRVLTMKTISLNSLVNNKDDDEEIEYYVKESSIPLESTLEFEDMNKTLLNLLLDSKLTDDEIIVLLLRFGIKTPANKTYTLDEIGDLLDLTREAVRLKEKNAINKLQDNSNLLDLIEYAENPSLTLRKLLIKKTLFISPYSKNYPDIFSYFPEYTKEEINTIIQNLPSRDSNFLDKITTAKYTKQEANKFYEIICYIYSELLNVFGRRPLASYEILSIPKKKVSLTKSNEINKRLNSILNTLDIILTTPCFKENYTFFDYFKGYDKELVNLSLRYIPDKHYILLQEKFGKNLDQTFIKGNNDTKDLLVIKGIIYRIKKYVKKLERGENLFSNIYLYFSNYKEELIDKVINNLSETDKAILHKRFGPDLKNPYKELELVHLTASEFSRLSLIIKIIDKNLVNELNKTLVEDTKNIPMNIYNFFSDYNKNLINYAVSKLKDNNRTTLFNIFGSKLNSSFNELKIKKINESDFNDYEKRTVTCIKNTLNKIRKQGVEEIINLEIRRFGKSNLDILNIVKEAYTIISFLSIKEIEEISSILFDNEKQLLNKIFNIYLNDSENIESIKKEELLVFLSLINKIIKTINKEDNISREEYISILKCITNNYIPNKIELRNNMILFLYLGIGDVEPLSISLIAKSFDLAEEEIKEIILLQLNNFKDKLSKISFNKVIKQLKQNSKLNIK